MKFRTKAALAVASSVALLTPVAAHADWPYDPPTPPTTPVCNKQYSEPSRNIPSHVAEGPLRLISIDGFTSSVGYATGFDISGVKTVKNLDAVELKLTGLTDTFWLRIDGATPVSIHVRVPC